MNHHAHFCDHLSANIFGEAVLLAPRLLFPGQLRPSAAADRRAFTNDGSTSVTDIC